MDVDTLEAVRHWCEGYSEAVSKQLRFSVEWRDLRAMDAQGGRLAAIRCLIEQLDEWEKGQA